METLTGIKYIQMHGAHNKIIVIDMRFQVGQITGKEAEYINSLPDLSFDQLMVILPSREEKLDFFVQIFNSDGSESGMCGNGMRCVGYVVMKDTNLDSVRLSTKSGKYSIQKISEFSYKVNMARANFNWQEIPLDRGYEDILNIPINGVEYGVSQVESFGAVSMGNPHAIIEYSELEDLKLEEVGPKLETSKYFPEKANISFVKVEGRSKITQRVWERGAGITLACGSGACAAVSVLHAKGLVDKKCEVHLPGGVLMIEIAEDEVVYLTGPVEVVSESQFGV